MKKRVITLINIFLSLAIIMTTMSGCVSKTTSDNNEIEAADITFTINYIISTGLANELLNEIVSEINTRSNGRIKGIIVPGGYIGDERAITEAIQLGTLDMAIVSDWGIDSVLGTLGWAWLPYMFTSYEEADICYNYGWISDELTRMMADCGIVRIASHENGFRQFSSVNTPIKNIDDFIGIKVRVPEIPEILRFYELIGALPVAIPATETYTALERKNISGVDNSVYNLNMLGLLDSVDYITKMNYSYCSGSIIASEDFWNKLSREDQEMITEVCKIAGLKYRKNFRKFEETLYDEYQRKGQIKVIEVSSDLDIALKEKGMQVWEEFKEKYDARLMERVFLEFGQ